MKATQIFEEICTMLETPEKIGHFHTLWQTMIQKKYLSYSVVREKIIEEITDVNPYWYCLEEVVCRHYGITQEMLMLKSNKKEISEARQCVYWILKYTQPKITLSKISRYYKKHHASVLYGVRKMDALFVVYRDMREMLKDICSELHEQNFLVASEFYTNFSKQIDNGTFTSITKTNSARRKSRKSRKTTKGQKAKK